MFLGVPSSGMGVELHILGREEGGGRSYRDAPVAERWVEASV